MATADARNYVLAIETNPKEAAQIAQKTADDLQTGQTNLLEVVRGLGEYINDEDEKIRSRAVNYLTAIILSLPLKYLSRQQIQVLNQFLCSRIEDGGAIEGLSKLQSLDRFTKEMVQDLVRAIFEHFNDLQSRPQSGRFKVYSLLNELLSNHRKAVRDMGDESLVGTVRVVSGEKDPRNLMLIFSMLRVFMIEWDISNHVETLFDAVYAYFPITFRPPPNDPYGITAQDLKDRLKDCIASNGALAPQSFPNLFDRLDSTSDLVKKDVLQALAACALNYSPEVISQYSITLWDTVKYEILQAQEPFLADEALMVIKNIAFCLSRSSESHELTDPLAQYLKPVHKECLEHLQEPASRQAKASGDILKAAASASIKSFELVLQSVGPKLFTLQQSSEGIVNQRAILAVTNQLFEAAIEVYGSWTTSSPLNPSGRENLLMEFKDKLVAIYSRALLSTVKEEVSYRLTAANGLLLLSQMRSLLADNEIGLFVQHFNDIVLEEESYGRDELKQRAMAALAEISKFKPQLITTITFPKFIARLPGAEDDAAERKDYRSVLEGLAEISVGKELLETLLRRLLNKLDFLLQAGWRSEYPYTCAVLSTIYYVLNRNASDRTIDFDIYFDRVVAGILPRATNTKDGPLINETVLNLLGRVANLITRCSSSEKQDQAAENVYMLFRDPFSTSHSDALGSGELIIEPVSCLYISTWLLAALPRSLKAGVLRGSPLVLVKQLISFAESCGNPSVQLNCLQQVALLINKHVSQQELTEVGALVGQTLAGFRSGVEHRNQEQVEYLVRLIFTLTKALILRLAPKTNDYLNDLVGLLQLADSRISRFTAMGFGTILARDEILSKTNDAQIRLLAPQRVFQTLVPIFSAKFRETDQSQSEQRETYLIALSGILGTVSNDIVMPELPTLLPLLLQSLDLVSDAENQNVKHASLETMVVVITKNPEALIESGHIPALVRRLLSTSAIPSATKTKSTSKQQKAQDGSTFISRSVSSPQNRRLATKCIALLPQYIKDKTPSPLLSLKREVLQGLGYVLDDPRRDVRKEAVDARAAWIRGVDDVDSDEDE